MSEVIETAVEDLKEIAREISRTPELPADFSQEAQTIDDLLTDIMNRIESIVEDLEKG